MKLSRPAAATAAAAVLAAACGSAAAPAPPAAPVIRGVAATVPAVSPAPYVAADVQFGLSLLRVSCAQDPDGNLVLSPASLGRGLGMAYLGARGATARAMAAVLHLPPAGGQELVAGLQARTQALRGLQPGQASRWRRPTSCGRTRSWRRCPVTWTRSRPDSAPGSARYRWRAIRPGQRL